jgi:hypothetical protein
MDAAVTVQGEERLVATLRDAGRDLADLSGAHAQVAARLVATAQGLVPVRTGTLRASLWGTATADTATVAARAPYAGFVHARTPFLTMAVVQDEPAIVDTYAAAVDDVLATVKGK